MKKVYGIYIFIFIVLGALFLYEYNKPQPVDWTPNMHTKGKNPFGQKILIERLDDLFDTIDVATTDLYSTAMQFEKGVPEIFPLEGTERTKAARASYGKIMTLADSLVNGSFGYNDFQDSASVEEYDEANSDATLQDQQTEEQNASSEYTESEEEERLIVRTEAKNSAYIITNAYLSMDQTDFFSLFTYAAEGRTVFIATERFSRELALNFQLQPEVGHLPNANRLHMDSLRAQTHEFRVNRYYRDLFPKEKYYVSKEITTSYFVLDADCPADTVMVNQSGFPVLIAYSCGKGKIYLCSTPLLFTNYEILHGNRELLTSMLVLLPPNKVYWDDYYKRHHKKFTSSYGSYERGDGYKRSSYYERSNRNVGNSDRERRGDEYQSRREEQSSEEEEENDQSILSFITSNASLSWAWYTLLFAIALYMLSSARRRQKLIPVIGKLQNTTVEFVQMIARLYYLKKDHRDIALKKINYFQEYLRSKYYYKDLSLEVSNIEALARRSNKSPEQIKRLFELIHEVQSQGSISAVKLHVLSQRINEFKSST